MKSISESAVTFFIGLFALLASVTCVYAQSDSKNDDTDDNRSASVEAGAKAPAPPPIELEEPIPLPDGVAQEQAEKDESAGPEEEQAGGPQTERGKTKDRGNRRGGIDRRGNRLGRDGTDVSGPTSPVAPRIATGGRVLAEARTALKTRGCEAAIPAYRVAAAMGNGFEAAQHELGDCLVSLETENMVERDLFREEGLLWLKRAAHAGNARAQRKLAVLFASPADPSHNATASLSWALAYQNNPDADLYGFGPLPRTLVDGLKRDLTPDEVAVAEAFAKDFAPIKLAPYEPKARPTKNGDKKKGNKKKRGTKK